MKKNFVFTILLALPLMVRAQPLIEVTDQRADAVELNNVLRYGEDAWLFSGTANPEGGIWTSKYFITARKDNGDVIWDYGHNLMEINWSSISNTAGDVLSILPNKGILLIGAVDYCDVASYINKVIRLDSTGALLWEFEQLDSEYSEFRLRMLARGDGAYHAIAGLDSVLMLNDSGEIVNHWLSPISPIQRMQWINDSTLMIATTTELCLTKTDGAPISLTTLSSGNIGMELHSDNSGILVLTNDSLYHFTSELQLDWSLSLQALDASQREFVIDNENVYINDGIRLWKLETDTALAVALEFSLLTNLYEKPSAALRGDFVMTASSILNHYRTSGIIKSYVILGTTVSHLDDVDISLQIDSTWLTLYSNDPNYFPLYYHKANFTALVTNRSPNNLNKILVSFRFPSAFGMCGSPGITIIQDSISVAPDEILTIPFNNVTVIYGPYISNQQICVVAISPNDHIDLNPSDNEGCLDIQFPVGIEELTFETPVCIYPNPANQFITVSWEKDEMSEIRFFDSAGKEVMHISAIQQSNQIDISSLPNGVYTMQLTQEKTNSRHKIVIQH